MDKIEHWKLNPYGVTLDEEELSVLNLVGRVTNKTNEVVDKINTQSHEIESLYNANKEKMEFGNVRRFGAKGDGVTDDTQAFCDCITACNNGQVVYIPNGNYIINDKITVTHENFVLKGEGINSRLNTSNNTPVILDLSSVINLTVENITCDNSKINVYPSDYIWNMENRNYNIKNLINNNETVATTNWGLFISTPKPSSYERTFTDSKYARYPIEISNHGGYNAININNVTVNEDGAIANPPDNSAIGITDKSNGVSGVVAIDMQGERRFLKFMRKGGSVTSGVNTDGIVLDVSPDGHIAIGCSYLNDDANATGVGVIKGRANSPAINLYDSENSNMLTKIISVNKEFRLLHNNSEILKANNLGQITKLASIITSKDNGLEVNNGTLKYRIYVDSVGRLIKADSTTTVVDGGTTNRIILENANGATSQRPTGLTWGYVGYMYFDQTLKKPIWWSGDKWVDATGTAV